MTRLFQSVAARWRHAPIIVTSAIVLVLLAAGVLVIVQNEAYFQQQKVEETRVQAEILAASVVAAVDFGDTAAAQENADAMRVNRQVRGVGIYDRDDKLIAGFRRDGQKPGATLAISRARGTPGVVAEVPVTSGGAPIGTVRLSTDPQPIETRLGRYVIVGLLAVMAALVVTVLGVAQAALARANQALESRAADLAEANRELTVQIAERAKAEEQLRQAQKMQALGQLTGGIAHDFNNLLTVIQGSADMLTRPELPEKRRLRFADAIVQAASRAAALTAQLLAFARRQPLRPEVIDVNALVAGMADLLDRTLGERIEVRTILSDGCSAVEADRAQLESAVLNIAVNARDAMLGDDLEASGTLVVEIGQAQGEDGAPMVSIAVTDTGSGMDAATIEHAMEPFFTTKSPGKGTGLGLSQVYGFATQSGGDLRIESGIGQGTTVTILLPCSSAAPDTDEASGGMSEGHRTGAVLLVEDNEEVGEFGEAMLRELGHRVVRARSGLEALEVAERGRFDVVLTDVVMPGMSGLELAERLAAMHPALPIVLTTGYSDEIARSGTGGRPVVLKPYRLETLAQALDEAIASRDAVAS